MDFENVLVTGGCGFIASNFLNIMVKKYPKTTWINLDAMYYCADIRNINDNILYRKNFEFIKGKIQSKDLMMYILKHYNIDAVVHFAAQSHVQNSFTDSMRYTDDNVIGTHTLLECCRKYGDIKRFIHVSTDEVYGESHLNDTTKKTESSILCPTNPYAASKAAAELIAISYYRSYNMPIIITRGNNVYGPNQYPEKLIPKFSKQLLEGKKCTIQGDGRNIRAFLYVTDVAYAFEKVLLMGDIGEIYNIGCDEEHSVKEIAILLIKKIVGEDANIDDHIEYIEDRNINDMRYYISSEKTEALGWKAIVDFDKGIEKTIEFVKTRFIEK
jgi:dTDP-glucose 4,6-dehydratase